MHIHWWASAHLWHLNQIDRIGTNMEYIITAIGAKMAYTCTRYFTLPNGNICLENPKVYAPPGLVPRYEPKRVEIPQQHALIERIK